MAFGIGIFTNHQGAIIERQNVIRIGRQIDGAAAIGFGFSHNKGIEPDDVVIRIGPGIICASASLCIEGNVSGRLFVDDAD